MSQESDYYLPIHSANNNIIRINPDLSLLVSVSVLFILICLSVFGSPDIIWKLVSRSLVMQHEVDGGGNVGKQRSEIVKVYTWIKPGLVTVSQSFKRNNLTFFIRLRYITRKSHLKLKEKIKRK
jgi:hypothetical protein